MSMAFRRAGALLVLGLVLAGCASPAASQFLSQAGMHDEAMAEYRGLVWPSGAAAPSFTQGSGSEIDMYEAGAGAVSVDIKWVCAWSQAWLQARVSSPKYADEALSYLDGVQKMPLWTHSDDVGRSMMTDAFSKARLGDPVPMQTLRTVFRCEP